MKKSYLYISVLLLFLISLTSCRVRKEHRNIAKQESHELKELHIHKDLRKEINQWLGVPYKYGGNDKKGVDCSGFVNAIYIEIYEIDLPRSSKDIYSKSIKIKSSQLKEGDLVFFDFEHKGVSHVGIYLQDGKYAHASSAKGVVISDLDNDYTKKNYVGAGRYKK